jgi:hypothetical protein
MIAAEKLKHHPRYLQRQRLLQIAEITTEVIKPTIGVHGGNPSNGQKVMKITN